ncbi:antirestriction protein [Pseudomonas sp. S2.OTC.A_B10]|uniref:antirestriction protein n=1 Tax=Pseudomonas sp. S2.OTC.A_B10 TaxID=3237018 RepID=UPI003CF81C95
MDTQVITSPVATLVADDDRIEFYPAHFGKYFMAAENLLYVHASRFVQGYQGGYWNFYTTTNGAFFAALDTTETLHVVIAENYTSEHMSAEAVGITLTLFVLGRLMNARIPEDESDRFIDSYHKLREFALGHAEAPAILTAID